MDLYPVSSCLFTETALNLDQVHAQSIIQISIPSASSFPSRNAPIKRRFISEVRAGQNDEDFTRRHIASEASIHFRPAGTFPRSILWRLLDSRRVLELRSVDLVEPRVEGKETEESIYTIQLRLPESILPFGVSFINSRQKDVLQFFVTTKSGTVFSFALPPSFFKHPDAAVAQAAPWGRSFQPPSFPVKKPYRLAALSPTELAFSTHEGSLVLLTRNDDHRWTETFLSHTPWSFSLKNFLPWTPQETVRFEDLALSSNCAAGMQLCPEVQYLFTVSLDHTLRTWNIRDGKAGIACDLVGLQTEEPNAKPSFLLEPSQKDLIKIVDISDSNDIRYYAVTYSPHFHRFKFWGIRDAGVQAGGYSDANSDFEFVPPIEELLNVTVWSLEEFVVDASLGWGHVNLWIRVQTGSLSRLFVIEFDLHADTKALSRDWAMNWRIVDPGVQTADHLRSICPVEKTPHSTDLHQPSSTEEWIDFLFYPTRFSVPSLESALAIYTGSGSSKSSSALPLKERARQAIERNVTASVQRNQVLDTDRFELEVAAQWRLFFALVKDLHQSRREVLSFAYDPAERLAWVVHADSVSPVRQCSVLDTILLNYDTMTGPLQAIPPLLTTFFSGTARRASSLLFAAHTLRGSLPPQFQDSLRRTVKVYASQDPTEVVSARLASFEQDCQLSDSVSDELSAQVTDAIAMIGGYAALESEALYDLLDYIGQEIQGEDQTSLMTSFGAKMLVQGSRETAVRHMDLLLDLLVFVVYIGTEVSPDELSDNFDPTNLFAQLLSHIKEQLVIDWLLRTVREADQPDNPPTVPPTPVEAVNIPSSPSKYSGECVIESMFLGDWQEITTPTGLGMAERITYWGRAWLSGLRLSQEFDSISSNISCFLIRSQDYDIALDFLSLLSPTPWNFYLQARALVNEGRHDAAAFKFKRAAGHLSSKQFRIDLDWALLTQPERACLSSGISKFYGHVADLFESHKVHSHAIDFADLAIDSFVASPVPVPVPVPTSASLTGPAVPTTTTTTTTAPDPSTDPTALLDRLHVRKFTNAMALRYFETAYSALTKISQRAVLVRHLHIFVTRLALQNSVPLLLSFPFVFLQPDVDAILLTLCESVTPQDALATFFPPASSSSSGSNADQAGPSFHRILYAWRIGHNDFRGAAVILYDLLQLLRAARDGDQCRRTTRAKGGQNVDTTTAAVEQGFDEEAFAAQNAAVGDCYLMLINALACCGKDQSWILTGAPIGLDDLVVNAAAYPGLGPAATAPSTTTTTNGTVPSAERGQQQQLQQTGQRRGYKQKRRILTLEDLRREYQLELDHISDLENGRFAFGFLDEPMVG